MPILKDILQFSQAAFVVAYFGPALGLGIALACLWRRAEARLDERRTDQQRSV